LLVLALAEQALGRRAAARKALARADQWLKAPSDDDSSTNREKLGWMDRLEVDLLRREVAGKFEARKR
jgi:hypothetical protein